MSLGLTLNLSTEQEVDLLKRPQLALLLVPSTRSQAHHTDEWRRQEHERVKHVLCALCVAPCRDLDRLGKVALLAIAALLQETNNGRPARKLNAR